MPVPIDLTVTHDAWNAARSAALSAMPGGGDLDALAGRAVEAALRAAPPLGGALSPDAELSILLCDDDLMRSLNRQWRGQDKPTNVLSFPAVAAARQVHLGDIAVAFETSADEARERGVPLADHLAHLLVHGVLHLLGYDHGDDIEAERMEELESRALASLGLASPYDPAGDGAAGGRSAAAPAAAPRPRHVAP